MYAVFISYLTYVYVFFLYSFIHLHTANQLFNQFDTFR